MDIEQSMERIPRQDKQSGVEGDACRHRPSLTRNEHRLTEHLSWPVPRYRPRTVEDVDGAREDHEESFGVGAGFVHRLPLGKSGFPEQVGDPRALRLPETTERGQREEALLRARTQHELPPDEVTSDRKNDSTPRVK